MGSPRRFKLEKLSGASMRLLAGAHVSLGEKQNNSIVTLLRTGEFWHPEYGDFDVSKSHHFASFIENYNNDTYGQKIFIDVAHEPDKGAAGEIVRLFVEGNRLRAQVAWTKYGIEAIRDKGFIYLSADFTEDYLDTETKQSHGPLLRGAGLVTRPHIKRMDPVDASILQLSEFSSDSVFINKQFTKQLAQEAQKIMEKYLKLLKEALAKKQLNDAAQAKMLAEFKTQSKTLGEDDAALQTLLSSFESMADMVVKELKEAGKPADAPVEFNFTLGEQGAGLDAAGLEKLLADRDAAKAKKLKESKAALANKEKIFSEALDAAPGLGDDTKKKLTESVAGLISVHLSDDQVKALAESQIALGNQMETSKQLAEMGFQVAGNPQISVDESNGVKRLAEGVNKGLKGSAAYTNKQILLVEETTPFVNKLLAEFDRIHYQKLLQEERVLSGAETAIADTNLPMGVQRAVIQEVFSDLNILQLVQTLTDATAQITTQVPYEKRDTSAVLNNARVFEGQGIPGASIKQEMDVAYLLPRKLAMKLSNEVIRFTRSSLINWDAYGRNVASNARVIRELVAAEIANEMQRVSDAHGAIEVVAEDVSSRLDGSNSVIKTASFPIVRPYQQYDLKGNAIGVEENPIAVSINGAAVAAYDGSGSQASGTYYRVTNYNLGYISLVDETGAAVTPTHSSGATTVSYFKATNMVLFDLALPQGTELGKHLDGLLRKIGERKAVMRSDRFIMPDYLLMSPVLNDTCTNAEMFATERKRDGAATTTTGDLSTVKGIPAYGTNAPGIDLGDERILMGQRGTTTYTVNKPFVTGTPFEAVDSTGKPTGEKVAYGEEYSAIHTPVSIRNRMTSVVAYDAAARAAL